MVSSLRSFNLAFLCSVNNVVYVCVCILSKTIFAVCFFLSFFLCVCDGCWNMQHIVRCARSLCSHPITNTHLLCWCAFGLAYLHLIIITYTTSLTFRRIILNKHPSIECKFLEIYFIKSLNVTHNNIQAKYIFF